MQLFGYQLVLYLMATRARGQDWGQEQPQDETRAGQLVPGPEYRSSTRVGTMTRNRSSSRKRPEVQ